MVTFDKRHSISSQDKDRDEGGGSKGAEFH